MTGECSEPEKSGIWLFNFASQTSTSYHTLIRGTYEGYIHVEQHDYWDKIQTHIENSTTPDAHYIHGMRNSTITGAQYRHTWRRAQHVGHNTYCCFNFDALIQGNAYNAQRADKLSCTMWGSTSQCSDWGNITSWWVLRWQILSWCPTVLADVQCYRQVWWFIQIGKISLVYRCFVGYHELSGDWRLCSQIIAS